MDFSKSRAGHAVLQADVEFRARIAVRDDPHLGLRFATEAGGEIHRRVHLDGEIVAGVEHLDEDGETRVIEEAGAENLLAVIRPQLVQRGAGKRAFIHDRLLFLTVHDFPRLAEGLVRIRQVAAVDVLEFATAPDAFHVEGAEGDGLHGREIMLRGTFDNRRKCAVIDPTACPGEITAALADPEPPLAPPEASPKRRGNNRRWVIFALLVLGRSG